MLGQAGDTANRTLVSFGQESNPYTILMTRSIGRIQTRSANTLVADVTDPPVTEALSR